MQYGVLGTGAVGRTLASKLVELGRDVTMGSRTADNPKAKEWLASVGGRARIGTFADAARDAGLLLNCTQGTASLDALRSIGRAALAGRILVDVANPLDFSRGMPPSLTICNTDSLGETLQREFPELQVVKALNTCNCEVMANPGLVPGDHDVFVCGNSPDAKDTVKGLLRDFGWRSIIDLGGITEARATEQVLPIWVSLYRLYGTPRFNFRIVRSAS